ncbi:MAG: formylmethanofuran dehydrogenase subunit E family protein [Candidatus Portnoybacteria bacterium]|nr:formylmethanofuran dehydrogenase subunit E family protein [Candidatus Portnoybacteria bacterium]MDD4982876.1 formylmethanofuran dehydrogenase subunit E family protein [Candidatus Portnoybacteria bacterium]
MQKCVDFHSHLCLGLVYGYLAAKEAIRLFGPDRSGEEVMVIPENDSCGVDALKVLLGVTTEKGNLILENYGEKSGGKRTFTIIGRKSGRAYRLTTITPYRYRGSNAAEFRRLDEKIGDRKPSGEEGVRHRFLKAMDLLNRGFDGAFETEEIPVSELPLSNL